MPSNSRTPDAVEHAVSLGRAVTASGGVAVGRIADYTGSMSGHGPLLVIAAAVVR